MHIISVFLTHRKAEKGKEPKVVTHRPQPSALIGDAATVPGFQKKQASVFFPEKKRQASLCKNVERIPYLKSLKLRVTFLAL